MNAGSVDLNIRNGVASVVFDRPQARNAMTWAMYERLGHICDLLQADASVRVVTFRGAGGEAFVAGTDIEQFTTFRSGDDGVAYEQQIDQCIQKLEALPMPTVAVVEGWAIGGGLAIATACDFRLATPTSRFGVPIARTLGNCLSVANLARLAAVFGIPRVKRMLMLAETLEANEALHCGFLLQLSDAGEIDAALTSLCERLCALAPVTQSVSKEGLRRLVSQNQPADEDLIRRCYGSEDFREGVAAFVGKRRPVWQGN
ncbi:MULTISPECIES: enoyl-CoA hydratase/isomerase family protein [unclassified Polaromonas]|jgi:enoyl-CoA hydratase/carnithine racemase|uniref:enoyl-CoA hydratase/isomerase family protein n=1 Tax=unclassified Polaromonas TaxID=2638319 RepID=UPI0018C970CB|nr:MULTISPECIES: enoyl-CoA hydratase/isomerase family protein [unclassified Polaromonas]MBG6072022.1 enoyl-CoA hydratase/carnithine racemase [Polaromonas sp. CG_9.7]MBG6114025.1 enoyl-CoA hydratase/carnithine racemase [Polaromonas sp. CG_9.2]MDH6184890.1 enoyl-CoA hydratase/carnithine racemase [Polaromonas sp. CG_23.6]